MKLERLTCDDNGNDPLVVQYQEQHGDCCAQRGVSILWCILGLFINIGVCIAYNPMLVGNQTEIGDALFSHKSMFAGIGIGYAINIVLAFILCRKISCQQEVFYGFIGTLMLYGTAYALIHSFEMAAGIATAVVCLAYLSVIAFRVLALVIGWFNVKAKEDDAEMLEWPVYTVLVPLYKEKNVANNIIKSLHSLDYPREQLDVKLLLEADDQETLTAIQDVDVPDWIETIVVPDAMPRTKPRACNHGLASARGEYLVIFDAEDKPDPDQLKKAVLRFDECRDERIICLQASLAYHNYKQNLLTRFFAIEYNMWFTRFQPGLVKLGGPLPLGGTSNHFKMNALKEVGGWDPYNVTEDCDLGVRLHAAGYRCDLLDSVTWEEANSKVGNWLRQRSRWLKGYMITHVVWMRHPLRLLFQLGPLGFLRFLLVISSVGVLTVLNPILWAIMAVYAVALTHDMSLGYSLADLILNRDVVGDRWSWPMLFLDPYENPTWSLASQILFGLSLILFLANFMFILIACLYGSRKDQTGLFWTAWLSPIYWVLMSIASWKALWQLIVKPHYWEKTVHGLDHPQDDVNPQEKEVPEVTETAEDKDADTKGESADKSAVDSDASSQTEAQSAESSDSDQSEMPEAKDDPAADSSSQ